MSKHEPRSPGPGPAPDNATVAPSRLAPVTSGPAPSPGPSASPGPPTSPTSPTSPAAPPPPPWLHIQRSYLTPMGSSSIGDIPQYNLNPPARLVPAYLSAAEYQGTLGRLNELVLDLEDLNCGNCLDTWLCGCMTCWLGECFWKTRGSRVNEAIRKYIHEQNRDLWEPRGLRLVDLDKTGFQYVRILFLQSS